MLITHDLGVIDEMCDNVAVKYAGNIIKYTDVYTLFNNSLHSYTKGLNKSMPRMNVEVEHLDAIPGMVPNFLDLPSGSRFHTRCSYVKTICKEEPELKYFENNHYVACYLFS